MEGRTIRITASQLVVMFVMAVALGGLLLYSITYVVQNGFPHLGPITQDPRTLPIHPIDYNDVSRYLGSRVAVDGYIIVTNDTQNICGSIGWSTCKTWFANDPINQGLGPLTVKINIGNKPDSITEGGDLFDHNGTHLNLIKTDQFSWYHATITGVVDQCKGMECIINVDTITALP